MTTSALTEVPATAEHAEGEDDLRRARTRLLEYIQEHCTYGRSIPGPRSLAKTLGLSEHHARVAVQHLDNRGVIAVIPGVRTVRLAPGEQHPLDVDLDSCVRARIATGYYREGQALPVGLLGYEHGRTLPQVDRAFRHLVAHGLVHHDEAGPHGPGYYVTPASQRQEREPEVAPVIRPSLQEQVLVALSDGSTQEEAALLLNLSKDAVARTILLAKRRLYGQHATPALIAAAFATKTIPAPEPLDLGGLTLPSEERDLIPLIAQGMSAMEMKRKLGRPLADIRRDIRGLRTTLRARNLAHVVTRAWQYRLLTAEQVIKWLL